MYFGVSALGANTHMVQRGDMPMSFFCLLHLACCMPLCHLRKKKKHVCFQIQMSEPPAKRLRAAADSSSSSKEDDVYFALPASLRSAIGLMPA